MNISELALNYYKSRKTIRKILFSEGLIDSIKPKRHYYFKGKKNAGIRNNLIKKYEEEKDLKILSEEFNIPVMSIYNFLRKRGIFDPKYGKELHRQRVRKYPLNEKYFNSIDCEEKAYFLGFLYADGTNSLKKTEIKLSLQEKDYEILKQLNSLLQPTKPILCKKPKGNRQHQRALIINSKIISYKLNELGMMPNKTFKLTYPTWLFSDLNRHFIRGYFDGDGGVTINKTQQQLQISFTGTENILLNIQNNLINECNLNKTKLYVRHPERNNNIRTMFYYGNGNARKFYYYIYNEAKLYMKRKKNKFEEILKNNNE